MEIVWKWAWRTFDEYLEKYGAKHEVAKLVHVLTYFEGIGILVEQGLLGPKLVGDMIGSIALYGWDKMCLVIVEIRRRSNSPDLFVKTEYPNGEMLKHYEEIHKSKFSPSMRSMSDLVGARGFGAFTECPAI